MEYGRNEQPMKRSERLQSFPYFKRTGIQLQRKLTKKGIQFTGYFIQTAQPGDFVEFKPKFGFHISPE
jgi:hypothetical protein